MSADSLKTIGQRQEIANGHRYLQCKSSLSVSGDVLAHSGGEQAETYWWYFSLPPILSWWSDWRCKWPLINLDSREWNQSCVRLCVHVCVCASLHRLTMAAFKQRLALTCTHMHHLHTKAVMRWLAKTNNAQPDDREGANAPLLNRELPP